MRKHEITMEHPIVSEGRERLQRAAACLWNIGNSLEKLPIDKPRRDRSKTINSAALVYNPKYEMLLYESTLI